MSKINWAMKISPFFIAESFEKRLQVYLEISSKLVAKWFEINYKISQELCWVNFHKRLHILVKFARNCSERVF
jgi:hypothetical protein